MGALFGVGSLCFAIGSIPLYFANVSPEIDAVTFAIGSVFFTAAAYVQYRETVHAPDEVVPDLARSSRRRRSLFAWRPHRIDWWACAIQLAGTLLFNVSTFAATRIDASVDHDKHLVWAPDVFGSVCFLIASGLAYAEVNRRWWPRSDGSVGWHIGALNLVGSILFGLSAFGARLVGSSGEPRQRRPRQRGHVPRCPLLPRRCGAAAGRVGARRRHRLRHQRRRSRRT